MLQPKFPVFHEAVLLVRPNASRPRLTALVGSVEPEGVELKLNLLFMDRNGTERWEFAVPHKTQAIGSSLFWCWPEELNARSN
jgi:hypothetical protein